MGCLSQRLGPEKILLPLHLNPMRHVSEGSHHKGGLSKLDSLNEDLEDLGLI